MSEYLVVTGMSGAGRSTAAASLEDARNQLSYCTIVAPTCDLMSSPITGSPAFLKRLFQ